jgi:outer membrane protein
VAVAIIGAAPFTLMAQDSVRITLPEAISLAAARNIDLIRAGNAVRAAQTRIETARGAFQPNLSISAGPSLRYQFGGRSSDIPSQVVDVDHASGSFSVGISSGYTLYNGNIDRATLTQAEQLARASDISVNRVAQNTVFSVISAYYQIATSRELIGVARENLAAEQRQLERIKAFTDAGTRPISDLYTEQATVAAAEFSLLNAQRDLEVANLGLVQTLRLDPLGHYAFPTPPPADQNATPGSDSALVAEAASRRPEIAAQQERIAAAEQAIKIAEAGKSPTVSVSGSLGSSYSTLDDQAGFGSQLFSQNPSASVGLSLSLPIFDRNRTDAAIEAARIDYENELLTMTELRQQASFEVRQALLDLNTARAQLDVAGRQLDAARQALDVEQARYETGVSTLTELTQARARYVQAEGQVVQARNTLELRRQGVLYSAGLTDAPRVAPQAPTEQEYRRQ